MNELIDTRPEVLGREFRSGLTKSPQVRVILTNEFFPDRHIEIEVFADGTWKTRCVGHVEGDMLTVTSDILSTIQGAIWLQDCEELKLDEWIAENDTKRQRELAAKN